MMIKEDKCQTIIGDNFERKCSLIVATGKGKIDLHRLSGVCKDENLSVHNVLGDIYMKMGKTPKAMYEYIQVFKECTASKFFDDSLKIHDKMLEILRCLSV